MFVFKVLLILISASIFAAADLVQVKYISTYVVDARAGDRNAFQHNGWKTEKQERTSTTLGGERALTRAAYLLHHFPRTHARENGFYVLGTASMRTLSIYSLGYFDDVHAARTRNRQVREIINEILRDIGPV